MKKKVESSRIAKDGSFKYCEGNCTVIICKNKKSVKHAFTLLW